MSLAATVTAGIESSAELATVLKLLGDGTKPLEMLASNFINAFAGHERFRVACGLCSMVSDKLLPAVVQRVTALVIVYEAFRRDGEGSHPFLPAFADCVSSLSAADRKVERNLLCILLADSPSGDVVKRTGNDLCTMLAAMDALQVPSTMSASAEVTKKVVDQLPQLRRLGVRPSRPSNQAESAQWAEWRLAAAANGDLPLPMRELSMRAVEPEFMRPVPPLLAPSAGEVLWLTPCNEGGSLLWDNSMCTENLKSTEVRELMSKAFKVCSRMREAEVGRHSPDALSHLCLLLPRRPSSRSSSSRSLRSWRTMRSSSITAGLRQNASQIWSKTIP